MSEERKSKFSEETRRKMSESHKKIPGRPHTEEERRKISEANKRENRETPNRGWGHPLSKEGERKLREAQKAALTGRPHTEEHNRKVSEALKGRKISQETIQKRLATRYKNGVPEKEREQGRKFGEASKGRKQTEETIEKKREAGRLLASDPEYLKRVSTGVKKAYEENPAYRDQNRQMLDSVREKAYEKTRNVPLSAERKAHLAETTRRSKIAYWAEKTYEERLAATANLKLASESVRVSSLEIQVKTLLDAMGFQYEQQKQVGMYWVDFYIPSMEMVIEVYGCYWHACPQCGYSYPKKNARDRSREAYVKACGYELVILWEHDLVEHTE